jgi:hypothetical protein
MTNEPLPEPEADDPELVPADDTVIGHALRWSLAALVVAAVLVGGVLLVVRRRAEAPDAAVLQAAAPRSVEHAAVAPPALPFVDAAGAAGIDFVHHNGAYGDKLLPEAMGSGAAVLDFDGDERPDLLFTNGTAWPHRPGDRRSTPRLYRNLGGWRFADATAAAGLDRPLYGTGVATGDFDADGRVDVYLTAVGENRLLRNVGGRFEDVTRVAGVAGDPAAWSTCAAFVDVDNDGWLDLFVCRYVRWSKAIDFEVDYRLTGVGRAYGPPMNYEGTHNVLYRNRGDGTFEDVSAAAGIQVDNPATKRPAGKALGVAPADVDGDGWIDLVIANDTVANFYLHNRGDGTFEEIGAETGLAFDRMGSATGAMGVDVGRHRDDGELAIVIGNFANEMTSVYVSQGDPSIFADEAITEGVGAPSRLLVKFGILLLDADLDGRLDLLAANGHLDEEIPKVDPSQSYRQPAQLFWNGGPDAPQTFVPVPPAATGDLGRPIVGRGATYADLDADGDLDLVLTQVAGPPLVLRNDQATGHHWLRVRAIGRAPNRDAIGARIVLAAGGVTQERQVMPARSYLSQVELPVTFGLGAATRVDALTVHWPGGGQDVVPDVVVDRLLTVRQSGR